MEQASAIILKRAVRQLAALGLGLCSLLWQASAAADDASFDGALITLPVVNVDGALFKVQMQSIATGEFQVTQAWRLTTADASGAATFSFSTNVLTIPRLATASGAFSAQLFMYNRSPLQLRLTGSAALDGSGAAFPLPARDPAPYAVLSNSRGGLNYEPVVAGLSPGFDEERSLAAFRDTVYPWLRGNVCAGCHNSGVTLASGAQAPLHADNDVKLAHQYALTRINFADPKLSKLYVRLKIDRHHCPRSDCAGAAAELLQLIETWKARIGDTLPETPRALAANIRVSEAEVVQWIAADKATLAPQDRDYIVYTSMHELHNEGLSADELNIVRVALSKALNSVARWAPEVVNPVDVNGKGLLYKFDIRDYWGWNKGVTRLLFGGSDDDLAFGSNKLDYRGNPVNSSVQQQRYNYASNVIRDPAFSKTIWERVLHGNVEGANVRGSTIPPYIDGFKGTRSSNAAGAYIKPEDLQWVETAQLVYTLTRPDVYNAIMMLPMYADQLEDELGVIRSQGMDSYDYVVSFDAITVDSRLLWRAQRNDGGWYWKTWDIFTGQLGNSTNPFAGGDRNIFEIYAEGGEDIRFPFWANPVPVFVSPRYTNNPNEPDPKFSFIATLAQPLGYVPPGCDPKPNFSGISGFYNCKHFTGTSGGQQSASEIIWNLPNGLQGYMLTGAFNQRRVDAFTNIVRDPRVVPEATDNIATQTGFTFGKIVNGQQRLGGFSDPRLNVGSSCIGCHIDGMNRLNNDLRDWLDENPARLPRGPYGVDGWINDPAKVARVRELYPPSSQIRPYIEDARKTFLGSMGEIKQAMILGEDKNVYVEPVIWTVEYVQRVKYRYPQTTSN